MKKFFSSLVLDDNALGAEDIIARRKRLHMSQRELAESLGVSIHTVQSWEQDKRKPNRFAAKFLNYLFVVKGANKAAKKQVKEEAVENTDKALGHAATG